MWFYANWFQIVFLREDSQAPLLKMPFSTCCELISICIFTWGFTSLSGDKLKIATLWIDFNLYFYVRIHKLLASIQSIYSVVNWFQFVFLREDSQVKLVTAEFMWCCELISICIFTWGFTSWCREAITYTLLWIDFNLYFYVRIHK